MYDAFSQMELLVGKAGTDRLGRAKIAVFGLGGIGSYVVETLARCGVGSLTLVDYDVVSSGNINRHLFALQSTVGRKKVQVAKERIRDIDENILVHTYETFYNEDTAAVFDLKSYDYIVDAIDLVSCKLSLIQTANERGIPIVSAMGTGNKLDPTRFRITDISKTSGCHLARVMRRELRNRGILHHTVLYSEELPKTPADLETPPPGRRSIPASVSWVPSCAGLMLAGYVVQQLADIT